MKAFLDYSLCWRIRSSPAILGEIVYLKPFILADILLIFDSTLGHTYPCLARALLDLEKYRQAGQTTTDPRVHYLEFVDKLRRAYGGIPFEQAYFTDSPKDIKERRRALLRRDIRTDFGIANNEFQIPLGHPKAKLTITTRGSIILIEHHLRWLREGIEEGWIPRPQAL